MFDLLAETKQILKKGKYMSINDVIAKYPQGITVNGISERTGVDKKTKEQKTYYTFSFDEDETAYISTGSGDLNKTVTAWLAKHTVDEINTYFNTVCHLRIMIQKITQSNGNPYVQANIVGTVPVENFGGGNYVDENGKEIDADTGEVLSDDDEDPFN